MSIELLIAGLSRRHRQCFNRASRHLKMSLSSAYTRRLRGWRMLKVRDSCEAMTERCGQSVRQRWATRLPVSQGARICRDRLEAEGIASVYNIGYNRQASSIAPNNALSHQKHHIRTPQAPGEPVDSPKPPLHGEGTRLIIGAHR